MVTTLKKLKHIVVSEDNYERLRQLGHVPESFDDIVTKLLAKRVDKN